MYRNGIAHFAPDLGAKFPVHIPRSTCRYSAFDEIIKDMGLHKVEVIGDAYFIAGGIPLDGTSERPDPQQVAIDACDAALAMLHVLPWVCADEGLRMRVGIHTGGAVAAVVGKKDPRFHLFGEVRFGELLFLD